MELETPTLRERGSERDEYDYRYCIAGNHRRSVYGQEAEQKDIRAWHHPSIPHSLLASPHWTVGRSRVTALVDIMKIQGAEGLLYACYVWD